MTMSRHLRERASQSALGFTLIGFRALLVMIALLPMCFVGCGKSDSVPVQPSAVSSDPIDTTELRKAFASASPGLRVYLDEALSLVRARNVGEAEGQFRKLLANPSLTAAQRTALADFVERMKTMRGNPSR